MYTRVQRIKRSGGRVDEYVQILESYRDHGKVRQKVVANLGNTRMLQSQLPALLKILKPSLLEKSSSVEPQTAAPYGIVWIVQHLFSELGLWTLLDRLCRVPGWADRVAVLVSNRLSKPSSEHGLGGWLETVYMVDRRGKRFLPVWKEQGRVKVSLGWLAAFYRTLDYLIAHKNTIEKELYLVLRDLFHLKVEVVFYDLTSTYFEGHGPAEIARYGHSRDGRPQNKQVLVGVVMAQNFPIAHHVLTGNLKDHQTVEGILEDLEKRFEVGRVVFVGDRGMVTTDTLTQVKAHRQGYLMGLVRRRRESIITYIESIQGPGALCPAGITAQEKTPPPETRVWEVAGQEPGVRVFVVHSEERAVYERSMRQKSMGRVKEDLEALQKRVAEGALKKPEAIGEAAGRILSKNHGHRYYDWKLTPEGRFAYFEHPVHFEREKKIEGKYVIQTEETPLTAVEAVQEYKRLSEVERGFRSLKDIIEMRPIYHQTEPRVKAHIFVAALAFLFERVLEKKLQDKHVNLSAREALQALQTISVVEFEVGAQKKTGVTAGSSRARQVLQALGITRPSLPGISAITFPKKADVVTHEK